MPETLYTSYECQLYGQAGLLAQEWNHTAFSLRDEHGTLLHHNLTMPELCKAHSGLHLPNNPAKVDVEVWVLCLSMSDAKPFAPYLPNDSMRDLCLNTAEPLWEKKQAVESGQLDVNGMAYVSGFHVLCAYCDWNADCPKFHDVEYQPEWQGDVQRLTELKNSRDALESEIEELEAGLKDAYSLTGMSGDWINTGSHRFKASQHPGRRTLNRSTLQEELEEIFAFEGIEGIDVEALLTRCEREGQPYARLNINPIHPIN